MSASADAASATPPPIPAHQTGRAQLGHPAFRVASPQTNLLGWVLPPLVICAVEAHPVSACFGLGGIIECGNDRPANVDIEDL
jgi:hypothetical protein